VVLTPGLGDGVQMIKAGIMEIADVFVVNKADLPGAQKTVQEIRTMLNMGPRQAWRTPIVQTVAASGDGLEEVLAAVERHRAHLEQTGEARVQAESRLKDEAADLVGEWARAEARRLLDSEEALGRRLLEDGTPYAAAEELLGRRVDNLVPEAARSEG
jgi:LAO/AO transport system kinase